MKKSCEFVCEDSMSNEACLEYCSYSNESKIFLNVDGHVSNIPCIHTLRKILRIECTRFVKENGFSKQMSGHLIFKGSVLEESVESQLKENAHTTVTNNTAVKFSCKEWGKVTDISIIVKISLSSDKQFVVSIEWEPVLVHMASHSNCCGANNR